MKIFDENNAVKSILARLAENGHSHYSDDEILNVVDMIWDFYETRGLLDPDNDDEPERADLEEELASYAATMLRRDKNARLDPADLPIIIAAELDYEDSLLDGEEGLDDLSDLLADND